MDCAWCGRKRGPLEHYTRFGFCHRCDALVRGQIKESLFLLDTTADRCDARLLRNRLGGGAEPADGELLSEIDEALGVMDDLEALRELASFFKTPLDEMRTRLVNCRAVLPNAPALPAPRTPPAMLPGETEAAARQRQAFRALLASLEWPPFEPCAFQKPVPRRNPANAGLLACAQVAAGADVDKLGAYIALDVKTTGPFLRRDEVIAVSAVRFEGFEPRAAVSTLVIPRRAISPRAAQRSGVDNEMVRGMPLMDEIIPPLREFLAGARLVGYNLPAELRFLYVCGIDAPADTHMRYDIPRLARAFLSAPDTLSQHGDVRGYDVPDYSLPSLCDRFGIYYENRYRPGADCLSMGLLFAALVRARAHRGR